MNNWLVIQQLHYIMMAIIFYRAEFYNSNLWMKLLQFNQTDFLIMI